MVHVVIHYSIILSISQWHSPFGMIEVHNKLARNSKNNQYEIK